MEIRPPRDEDEERQTFLLRAQAFNIPHARYDAPWPQLPRDRHLVAVDGGRMVGTAVVWDLGQFFGGRSVPMGGVAGVAVAPDRRGTGVGRALLEVLLGVMRERGEVLSALYPATVVPYRRMGWEVAGHRVRRRVPLRALAELPAPRPGLAVRPVTAGDRAGVQAHYRLVAATTDGFLDRSSVRWARTWFGSEQEHHYAYLAERGGQVAGHLIYHHADSTGPDDWVGLEVEELVASDPDAMVALWRLLATNRSVSARVTYHGGVDDPLYHLLAEQDLDPQADWRWMLRLVDVAGAVSGRGFPSSVQVSVPLTIHDPQVAANAGPWWLRVKDGQGWLEPGGPGAVALSVQALAALYTGHSSPWALAASGLVTGAEPGHLADLSAAFAGPAPWMVDFF